jgi:hypothetical protein
MKEKFLRFKESGLFYMIIFLLCTIFGICDGSAMTADVVNPAGGGAVDVNATTTATETRVNSPHLLLDTIDEKVTKIRPYDVTLETISRNVSDTKTSDNQTVRHYAIDVIDLTATLAAAYTYAAGTKQASLTTSNDSIFAREQTIIVKGVNGYLEDGVTVDTKHDLVLYVVEKDSSGHPIVTAVNGQGAGDIKDIPAIAANTKLIRAGRAGSELQIQTDAYSGVPTDWNQYLQKFMAQVEVSTLFERAEKEVDWTFTDEEEEAVFDMKRVQNVTYWLGVKRRIKVKNAHNKKAEDVYFTEGVWTQAGKDFSFGGLGVDVKGLVALMKHSFTGNNSGKRKLIICGSDVIEALETVDYNRIVREGTKSQAYGIEVSTIVSKFGTLMVVHDQSLDDMGMADKAFILDADFLRKWTMGWRVNEFDFRKSGQSDADGRMLMEICGLVLKNPNAHSRVSL